MGIRSETFYAICCDFPDCGELYDGGDFTYSAEPGYQSDLARDDGWLTGAGADGADAYCPTHVVVIDCPPDAMVGDVEGDYCQWCEDNGTDEHLAPMPDTWENRLELVARKMVSSAEVELDWMARRMRDDLGPRSALAARTDRALTATWEATCRAFDPDVTPQRLSELRYGSGGRDGAVTIGRLRVAGTLDAPAAPPRLARLAPLRWLALMAARAENRTSYMAAAFESATPEEDAAADRRYASRDEAITRLLRIHRHHDQGSAL